jgi:hypothetical protein
VCQRSLLKRLSSRIKAFVHEIYQDTEKCNLLLPNYGGIKSFCQLNGSFSKAWQAGRTDSLV